METRPQPAVDQIATREAELREELRALQERSAEALKDMEAKREDVSDKQSTREAALDEMHWMRVNGGILISTQSKNSRLNPKQPSAVRGCRLKGFLSQRLHKTRQTKIFYRQIK